MNALRIVVVGTLASDPYAGMAWMIMQIVVGLRRLGHDAWYFETTSTWPFDPSRQARVADANYAVPYLMRVAERFGIGDRWAYRRSYSDGQWVGPHAERAPEILASADLVFNVAGATRFAEEGLRSGRLIYFGTDPVFHEVNYAAGDDETLRIIDEHADTVTYGENIGRAGCPIPPLPRLRARTRQPVLLDLWQADAPTSPAFTTVGNWKQGGRDVVLEGETYRWSKHYEFLEFISLPQRTRQPMELATNLARSAQIVHGPGTAVPALGFEEDEYEQLVRHGWRIVDGPALSMDPWTYRDYIVASRAEFTVARDLNVRLRSGWFSERSACYLAAGRPVVTQDTGFGCSLPTGEGLFAFTTTDEILDAIDRINTNYARHSEAARAIAQEYFQAERVLGRLLSDLSC